MAVPAIAFDWERVRSTLPELLRARVQNGRELLRRRAEIHRETPLPTGLEPLDRLLHGGLERGVLTELAGGRSSGRFAVALQALAAATQAGEAAALVDLGGQLDPTTAAAAGCDLTRLLWAQPGHLRQALAAAETLLQAGFPLVVLDLGQPPVPGGRGQEAAWTRLARAAEAQRAALLVSAPYRASGTAAATVLTARAARAAWLGKGKEPRLLAGLRTTVTLQKSRLQSDELRSCELRLTVEGILDLTPRDPRLLDSAALRPPALSGKRKGAAARGARPQPPQQPTTPTPSSAGAEHNPSDELASSASPTAPLPEGAGGRRVAESRRIPGPANASPTAPGHAAAECDMALDLAAEASSASSSPERTGGRKDRESRKPRTSYERYEIERHRN